MAVHIQKNGRKRSSPQTEEDQDQREPDEAAEDRGDDEANEQDELNENDGGDEEEDNDAETRKSAAPAASKKVDRNTLVLGLNHDLAGEYQAILMYTHYAAKLTGPYRKELRALFQAEIADEQGHAQFLADKIAVLGGQPTTQPRPVIDAGDPRDMLQNALKAEIQAINDYRERIEQADSFGDIGLRVDLESQIADETRHKEELERILSGWDRQ